MEHCEIKIGDLVEISNIDLLNCGMRLFVVNLLNPGNGLVAELGCNLDMLNKDGTRKLMSFGIKIPVVWIKKVGL